MLRAKFTVAAVTDGSVVLALHHAEFASPTITYYGSNVQACLNVLQANGVKYTILKNDDGKAAEIEFTDLNGQRVILKSPAPVLRPNVGFELMTLAGPQNSEICGWQMIFVFNLPKIGLS